MADYIIVATILLAFFLKQLESYYDEKFKNVNDSYSEAKLLEKIKRINFFFNLTMLVFVMAITYWVYKVNI